MVDIVLWKENTPDQISIENYSVNPIVATMELQEAYDILSLTSGANKAEIKKAFRKKAHLHHPDRILQCEGKEEHEVRIKQPTEEMKVINNAKETLMKAAAAAAAQPEPEPELELETGAVLAKKREGRDQTHDSGVSSNLRDPGSFCRNSGGKLSSGFDAHPVKMIHNHADDRTNWIDIRRLGGGLENRRAAKRRRSSRAHRERVPRRAAGAGRASGGDLQDGRHGRGHGPRAPVHGALGPDLAHAAHGGRATAEDVWGIARYTWFGTLRMTARLGAGEWER